MCTCAYTPVSVLRAAAAARLPAARLPSRILPRPCARLRPGVSARQRLRPEPTRSVRPGFATAFGLVRLVRLVRSRSLRCDGCGLGGILRLAWLAGSRFTLHLAPAYLPRTPGSNIRAVDSLALSWARRRCRHGSSWRGRVRPSRRLPAWQGHEVCRLRAAGLLAVPIHLGFPQAAVPTHLGSQASACRHRRSFALR